MKMSRIEPWPHTGMVRFVMVLIATDKNRNEAKFNFQGQSARSQRWFDLEFH